MRAFPLDKSWLQGRKYLVTRVALFVAACLLVVCAMFMLNATTDKSNRNQQVTSQMMQSDTRVDVLVLASYDDADPATKLQRDGLLDLLDRSQVAADVEYLDARATAQNANVATSTAAYGSALANTTWGQAIAAKVAAHGPYSAVICIDDDALCFIEATHDSLFAKTPVVFLGVSDQSHAQQIFEVGYATGLLEAYDTRNTIETAASMRPAATNMLVITDNTATGTGNRAAFEQAVATNSDLFAKYQIEYANASRTSRAALADRLSTLGDDTMVVYLDATADSAGNAYDAGETAYFLAQASAQPIFSIGLNGTGEGFAGSGFIDYEGEGLRAGEIAIDVLNGTRPADIAVETYSSKGSVYDTQVLSDYGIAASLVPSTATLVHQSGFSLDSVRSISIPLLLLVLGIGCIASFAYLGYRRTVLQMEDIVTQRNALEHRFYTDNLTEMPNMQWLTQFAGTDASSRVRSIVGVDLFEVEQLDETRGAGTSDEVVKLVSERLNGLNKAFLVRPGHSEFIIGTDRVLKRGGKFLDEIEYVLNQPVYVEGEALPVQACVGVFNRERGTSIEEMVAGVELAIRQAEEAGNTDEIVFYDRNMREAEEQKLAITSTLRTAILQDELHVLYQPQVELSTNKVVGYEALVRLRDEPYPPDQFIPIAEASDQIIEIDRIVTRKVAQQLATWKKRKQRMLPVSINHSFGQLRDDKYVSCAKEALDENRINTRFLRIEIKEHLFLNNMARATNFIDELREEGFGIIIDGFGAGYTSLGRVMQIPADVIKIDRSLTEAFLQGGDASVIANLVRLAHSADKKVVIEGVETAEQLQMCVDVGCDIVQGFYLSEPLLPEKALQYKPPVIDCSDRTPAAESAVEAKVAKDPEPVAEVVVAEAEPVVAEPEPVEAEPVVEVVAATEEAVERVVEAAAATEEAVEPVIEAAAATEEVAEPVAEAEVASDSEPVGEAVVEAEDEAVAVVESADGTVTASGPEADAGDAEAVSGPEAVSDSEVESAPEAEPASAESDPAPTAELEPEGTPDGTSDAQANDKDKGVLPTEEASDPDVPEPVAASETEGESSQARSEAKPDAADENEESSSQPEASSEAEGDSEKESQVARKSVNARLSAATSGVAAKVAARNSTTSASTTDNN